MNCPKCHIEMDPGFLSARYPVVWTGKPRIQTFFLDPEDVRIGNPFSFDPLSAHICKACKAVLFEYED